jgi:hypothetical protein
LFSGLAFLEPSVDKDNACSIFVKNTMNISNWYSYFHWYLLNTLLLVTSHNIAHTLDVFAISPSCSVLFLRNIRFGECMVGPLGVRVNLYKVHDAVIVVKNQTWRWHACAKTCHPRQQLHLEIVLYRQEYNKYYL